MKDLSGAFLEAETLLRKYGFVKQADLVRAGAAVVQSDGITGYAKLASLDWWGGSGSIADVYLYREGESFTAGQEKDNRALRAALLSIQQGMQDAGVHFDRANDWARAFDTWRANGL